MLKKIAAAGGSLAFLLTLSACGQSFTFEADPSGTEDTSENGWTGDPADIRCFTIEADSSSGDDSDQQLGEFCRDGAAPGRDDDDSEVDD